jgi:hypothetical protein
MDWKATKIATKIFPYILKQGRKVDDSLAPTQTFRLANTVLCNQGGRGWGGGGVRNDIVLIGSSRP